MARSICFACCLLFAILLKAQVVIRHNLLGYQPESLKIAVLGVKQGTPGKTFRLVSATTKKVVFQAGTGQDFGAYGPFIQSFRLNFSKYQNPGTYFLESGSAKSESFRIAADVYKGSADFCLRYMRQQRSGFNPYLNDSCHTHDGYTLYGPMPDSTHIDVSGGWHDASDYLQYGATSANAICHLLLAERDFPEVFGDTQLANGLAGKNGIPDVVDEAKWGLDWLLKMHPSARWMFNQLGDDRDHQGMRLPKEDSFYGKGYERPVYFITGLPQQRGKFLNNTTGTSSTAGKYAAAFALGAGVFGSLNPAYSDSLSKKAGTSLAFALQKPGSTQTVSVRSPYIYAEDNWVDDLELAYAAVSAISPNQAETNSLLKKAETYAKREPVTPWLGADTANHYQWYPFINLGHYEMARRSKLKPEDDPYLDFYQQGIERVWLKAKQNAFFRGVPFIWCSNNLTTSFAIQCYWYRTLSHDTRYAQLEQANVDWLLGCNPWGTSMVYGLPANGDTPADPHSAFTHLKQYPIDGGLVDGPVFGSIYKGLIGISLKDPDEYASWQSDLAVYHDDYGDYSTNEPTMDGTASLIYLLASREKAAGQLAESKISHVITSTAPAKKNLPVTKTLRIKVAGRGNKREDVAENAAPINMDQPLVITRGDTSKRVIALVFTGHEFGDGGKSVLTALKQEKVKASFFFTGDFYRNKAFAKTIRALKAGGHYLGAHSDKHLLYAPWTNRDSLLLHKEEFVTDLENNYGAMKSFGVNRKAAPYFLPPYEWWNDSIASWTRSMGLQLINYTPGTLSNADYTTPEMPNYRNSDSIYQSIIRKATDAPTGMNGYILLLHLGTDPARPDKFYNLLPLLLQELIGYGYRFVRIDQLLKPIASH